MEKNAVVNKRLSRRSFLQAAAATAGVMVTGNQRSVAMLMIGNCQQAHERF